MRQLITILFCILLIGCNRKTGGNPHISIVTSEGDIEVELYPEKAPKTVAAFLAYIDSGYYTNSSFYRVVLTEGFSSAANIGIIQGGIWQTSDQQHPNVPGIAHESTKQTGLSHTSGTISLARTQPGTANTEFFICIGDQTQFDFRGDTPDEQGFAAFGKVTEGMKVVRQIQLHKKQGESLTDKVTIKRIERL